MKKRMILAAALALAALTACSAGQDAQPSPTPDASVPTPAAVTPAPTPTPVPTPCVYTQAEEDYLLPADDYSWEREHEAEYVMIHFTSAVVADPENPYDMNTIRGIFEQTQVSVHYIIDREGTVYCYVPENRVAWHAGKGTWGDDEKYTDKMNHYAIGIELVAIGSAADMTPYLYPAQYAALDGELIGFTDGQYDALRALVEDICQRHNIPMDADHVIGHSQYSPAKTDPGELFDWNRLLGEGE